LVIPAIVAIAFLSPESFAQKPLLSPRDSVELRYDTGRIVIDYGRPSMRGRKIMGELVPYNRWWRTGANEATSFRSDMDIRIGDTVVPAGSYTLYTQPSEHRWMLIINRQTGQWGTIYNQDLDLVRIPLEKKDLTRPSEKFTILLERTGHAAGVIRLQWELTDLTVPFTVPPGTSGDEKDR